MSKAFTRESDAMVEPPRSKPVYSLPDGVKNYMTSQGLRGLHEKLSRLLVEPVSETSRREIYELRQCLQSAEVPEVPPLPWNQVFFGAIVTVLTADQEQITYRLVGLNEADPEHDRLSWRSPLARALLKAKMGDDVRFQTPDGEQHLTVIGIYYEPQDVAAVIHRTFP